MIPRDPQDTALPLADTVSHMSHRKKFLFLALLIGAVVAYRQATADKGGTFDPNHPERS